MFAAGRQVWYLPFTLILITFIVIASLSPWLPKYGTSKNGRYPVSLNAIFTPETLDALNSDPRLRDALLSLTEAIAQSSTDLGEHFRVESLKRFGANLTDGVTHLRVTQDLRKQKRGLLYDVENAFGSLKGGAEGRNSTSGLSGIFGGLSGSLAESLSTPALFLGIGLGMGTSTGLNLTDMQKSKAQATKVASAYTNASATGVNLIAQNLGTGLAGQITPYLVSNNISLSSAAYALASGIGNATAMGFKLTQQRFLPSNDSSIEAIAGNFGLGVAMPIVSNIDIQAVMKSLTGDLGGSTFMQQLPDIARAAGMGLGEGAKDGLGLSTPAISASEKQRRQQLNNPQAGVNVSETIGSFTKGLSQSFTQGSDLSKLNLTGGMNLTSLVDLQTMLRPIATGAGAGIGMGIAIGFNLKAADATPIFGNNIPGNDEQTALIAEGFVQNLFTNFIHNSTVPELASQFLSSSQSMLLKDIDPAKAAEGFARGTIEGVMSAMSSVGGLKNLISGDVPPDAAMNVPVLGPTNFNDSVNGSVVGFARGLTGEGTILVAEIVRNLTKGTQNSTAPSSSQKRSDSYVPRNTLSVRQTAADGTKSPPAIDAATLQMGAQKAVDLLTCQGIGGLASAGLALMDGTSKSGTKNTTQSGVSLDPRVLQSLPQGPIRVTSGGNNFQIVIKDVSIEINGLTLIPFAVITALHVVFTGLAFLTFLPLYIILGVIWRFSVLTGYPVNEVRIRKWRVGFLITFAILSISGIILGIVGMGNAGHFRDTHGFLGLVSFILIFPAVGFSVVRMRTSLPHPSSSDFTGIKAAIAIAKTPSRIYLISGVLLQFVLATGSIAFAQGFATLRSISLCVVDAVLTSSAIAGLLSVLLMIQISATGLAVIRSWLEQHIAKREAAGESKTSIETGEVMRQDSIISFGSDRRYAPPPLDLTKSRPKLVQRRTEDLKGFEDSGISTPFNVKKEGGTEVLVEEIEMREDPFLSPEEQSQREERRTYNPKIGGYEVSPSVPNNDRGNFYTVPVGYQGTSRVLDGYGTPYGYTNAVSRASSEVFNVQESPRPQMRAGQGPKTENVTTQELFLPTVQKQLTGKSEGSSYSRPFDGRTL